MFPDEAREYMLEEEPQPVVSNLTLGQGFSGMNLAMPSGGGKRNEQDSKLSGMKLTAKTGNDSMQIKQPTRGSRLSGYENNADVRSQSMNKSVHFDQGGIMTQTNYRLSQPRMDEHRITPSDMLKPSLKSGFIERHDSLYGMNETPKHHYLANKEVLKMRVQQFIQTRDKKKGRPVLLNQASTGFARPESRASSNTEAIEGRMIKGKKIVIALDLKFSGKLKDNQHPPQIYYTEDSVRQLIANDSLKYEKSKPALMKEFQELQAKSYYLINSRKRVGTAKA